MKLHVWKRDSENNHEFVEDNAYVVISEDLCNWGYRTNRPPNQEVMVDRILNGEFDQYFDYTKDIVDIGACHGIYAIELVKKFNHAYAFEANKSYCCLINTNVLLNNVVDKVDVYNTVLSSDNKMVKYNGWSCDDDFKDSQWLANCCYETFYTNDHSFKDVPARSLDSFNLRNVGFIKIDVEGHELSVLLGAISTIINNNYPPILFELWKNDMEFITDKEKYKEVYERTIGLLTMLGYEIMYNVDQFDGTHFAYHK